MRPPVIVTSSLDLAAVLRGDREAAGITGENLDAILGWPDRYTAKAENPDKRWGRTTLRMGDLFDAWLTGLNRSLILMDANVAEQIVREHDSSTPSPGLERRVITRLSFTR